MISAEQRNDLEDKGFFIQRRLLSPETVEVIRHAILDFVENPGDRADALDKELAVRQGKGDHLSPQAQYRKIQQLGRHVPEIWDNYYAAPEVLAIVSDFLNSRDVYLKYDSVFLKPAKTGGATPWHQDIGLWRDSHVGACNAWFAIEPATRENGCMQFVPGSHKNGLVEHVKYDDGLHLELPRDLCSDLDVEHIEMEPGDVVFWHSWMWHYSPPNRSDHSRIAMGSVWVDWKMVTDTDRHQSYFMVMNDGECMTWPPKKIDAPVIDSI